MIWVKKAVRVTFSFVLAISTSSAACVGAIVSMNSVATKVNKPPTITNAIDAPLSNRVGGGASHTTIHAGPHTAISKRLTKLQITRKQTFQPFRFPVGSWKGVVCVSRHFPRSSPGISHDKASPFRDTLEKIE